MTRITRVWFFSLVATAALLACPTLATANWITIKNDTGKAIVVQENVLVEGKVRRGKAKNLLPGETHREFLPAPTNKRVEVYESRNFDRALWSGSLDCKEQNQVFSIRILGEKVTVTEITPLARK